MDAAKLAQRRLALNLSQKAAAKRAGLDATHLSQLEAGIWRSVQAATAQRLAAALECQIAELAADGCAPAPATQDR